MSTYGLYDRIPFGKHEGDTVKWIIDHDKSYFFWMVRDCSNAYFTKEAFNYANGRSASSRSSYRSEYSEEKEDEYQRLLSLCRRKSIKRPVDLSDYITENDLGLRFPRLSGDVDFDNGYTLENGIAPSVYGRLCEDLGFNGPWTDTRVVKFTPNKDLYR